MSIVGQLEEEDYESETEEEEPQEDETENASPQEDGNAENAESPKEKGCSTINIISLWPLCSLVFIRRRFTIYEK